MSTHDELTSNKEQVQGQINMSMTDPIADMLTRIRNAILARKAEVEVPASKLKEHIASILQAEGYIKGFRTEKKKHPTLYIDLKWSSDHRCAIEGLRRISRPGQRKYVGKANVPRIRGGQGIAILTTSRGVMSDRNARGSGIGGEVICEVW